tara:strand:- start:1382 stop:1564 length:183 start_codon:yes stop_codon:yes gene_type:complete
VLYNINVGKHHHKENDMKNLASLFSIAAAIVVTDYLALKLNGTRLDRYPLKDKDDDRAES